MPEIDKDEVLRQAKISHKWMLQSMLNKELSLDNSNYSDKLKHAILVGKLLEMVE